MPFSNTTKRFTRVWSFVSQFIVGENAQRSDFDTAFNDVATGLNDAIAYLESLFTSGAATDLRYVGTLPTEPTERVGGSSLVAGDFYFDTTINEPMVYDGADFAPITDLPTATNFFKSLFVATDAPALRGLLLLGTAATQNIAVFATAAQGAKADAAVLAPSGIANTVTDWLTVHTTGTGFYEGAAGAANAPVAIACTGHYIKKNATSGILRVTDTAGRTYENVVATNAFVGWKEVVSGPVGASAWDIASNAEAIARTANNRIITPLNLGAAIDDRFTFLFGATGYISIKLNAATPRFYLQWGRYSIGTAASAGQRVAYPQALANSVLGAWLSVDNAATNQLGVELADLFGYTVRKGNGDTGARAGSWYVIGY